MARIVVVGSINMDLVTVAARFPAPGETLLGERFLTVPGGKGANQAVAAARLGAEVTLVGAVGDDAFGASLKQGLADSTPHRRGTFPPNPLSIPKRCPPYPLRRTGWRHPDSCPPRSCLQCSR